MKGTQLPMIDTTSTLSPASWPVLVPRHAHLRHSSNVPWSRPLRESFWSQAVCPSWCYREVVSIVAWRFKILCSQKWLAKVGLDTVALMMDVMVIGIVGKEELARIPP